jgi:hypothetical protein
MKKLMMIFALLLFSTLTSAITADFSFDTTQNKTQEIQNIIYTESLVLQIQTTQRVLCRYSTTAGTPFDFMASFDDPLETIHKKTLTDLSTRVHRYFVRCRNISNPSNPLDGRNELQAIFTTSNLISAVDINIVGIETEEDALNSGKHEINLITSKIPFTTPTLTYSYDGIIYNPITLYGSGTNWKGYLMISESTGEKIGSFKFEAKDIEGRIGTNIREGSTFIVDTKAPSSISSLEAIGEYKQIRLEWVSQENEDIETINIYKSIDPNVGYTDFYKSIDGTEEDYTDEDVTSGKTYYYKIAPEDLAGNIADLSREITATARTDNKIVTTGLSPYLIGSVDAALTELALLEKDALRAQTTLNNFDEPETTHLKTLGLFDNIESTKSEITALKKEIENYKLQDLTSEILNSRLASSRIKINIIKKKIPDTITSTSSNRKEIKPTEESLRIALIEYFSELTPSLIDKSVKESQALIEEHNVKIQSQIDIFEITFLDGTRQSKSLIQHYIDSTLEKSENKIIILKIPASIPVESLKIKNIDYTEGGTGLIKFGADTKEITYIIDTKLDPDSINEINVAPLKIAEDKPFFTGNFLSNIPGTGSMGMTTLILLACSLVVYLTLMRKRQKNSTIMSFIEKAEEVKYLQKIGQEEKANELYNVLKSDYLRLNQTQKSKVFEEVKHLSTEA